MKVVQTSGIVIMFSFVFWQMYIGLVIGILGVTVVLLVVTIVVMMRRNKQKIFNKNSMYVLITCFHES